MEYSIEYSPMYSILKVRLSPGESLTVEPGAYMLHKGDLEVKTSSGGIFKGLARALMGGESFFMNTIVARGNVEIWIAPSLSGDIKAIELNGNTLFIQDSSYLAHVGNIDITTGWRGLRGLIAEGELVWLKASGYGIVFINSYGAMEEIKLDPGERITVDNMHFVALEDTVSWNIRKWGGWKTFFFGGEGIVIDAVGPGRIWVQTRNLPLFARILRKFMPQS
ncbi:MAG: TIGR00266 family protein [Desulfurococcales archaeon]|nr:TIGR00266 family protein [Desulfurococcales archaeon]